MSRKVWEFHLYVKLFQHLSDNKVSVPAGDGHRCGIEYFHRTEVGRQKSIAYSGNFCRFQHLDDWYNSERDEAASDKDLASVLIPKYLIPGMRKFEFVFFPEVHRLCFEMRNEKGKSLSSKSLSKFLTSLLQEIADEFDLEAINIQPQVEHETIENILEIPKLQKLKYTIKLPNPDIGNGAEARIEARMRSQGINESRHELKGSSIEPDEATTAEIEAAAHNGHVHAVGKSEAGDRIEIDTANHPMTRVVEFDDNTQNRFEALRTFAYDVYNTLRGNLNR